MIIELMQTSFNESYVGIISNAFVKKRILIALKERTIRIYFFLLKTGMQI